MPPDPPGTGPLSRDREGSPAGSAADERLRSYLTAVLTASSGERRLNLRRRWHAHPSLQTTRAPGSLPAGDTAPPLTAVAASRARRADWDQLEFVWSSCDESDTTKLLGFLNRLTLSDSPEIQSLAARGKMIVGAREELLGHCPDAWSPRLRSLLLQALIRPWSQSQGVREQLKQIPPEEWGRPATVKPFFLGLPELLPGFDPRHLERLSQWCQRCAATPAKQQSLAAALGHGGAADKVVRHERPQSTSHPESSSSGLSRNLLSLAIFLSLSLGYQWLHSGSASNVFRFLWRDRVSPGAGRVVTELRPLPGGATPQGPGTPAPPGEASSPPVPSEPAPGSTAEANDSPGWRQLRQAQEELQHFEALLVLDTLAPEKDLKRTYDFHGRLQRLDDAMSLAQQRNATDRALFEQFRELRKKCSRLQQRVAP